MEIILIFNGLGNQMSQYAFYLAKKQRNAKDRCLFYTSDANHNGYELERIFGIRLPEFKNSICYQKLFTLLYKQTIFIRLLRKLLQILKIVRIYRENLQSYDFDAGMLQKGKALINFYWGGWHSYKYIAEAKDVGSQLYQFNTSLLSERTAALLPAIKKEKTVSIHIRRGDYTKKENYLWGGVATLAYYKKAISCLGDVNAYQFFVFSDDIAWAKENLFLPNAQYVDWNTGLNAWQDMYIMSQCQININPNSTFSWWASYLNTRADKKVYVPDRFVVTQRSKDFYPQDWNQIEVHCNEV